MRIPIPHRLARAWAAFDDSLNDTIWWHSGGRFGRWEIRRIDLVIAAMFWAVVGWYGWQYGWRGALIGGGLYTIGVVIALVLRPPAGPPN